MVAILSQPQFVKQYVLFPFSKCQVKSWLLYHETDGNALNWYT